MERCRHGSRDGWKQKVRRTRCGCGHPCWCLACSRRPTTLALFLAAQFTDDEASVLTEARLARQAILEQADQPQATFVLDETVLHRQIGSSVTMAEQLDHIADAAELRYVNIHVLPALDANAGLSGSFSIAGADSLPETLLMETVEDHTTQDRALVRRAAVIFDLVRRDALPRVPSRAFILEASEQWKTR